MKFAIPITDGKLSSHFGHCEQFSIIDTDDDNQTIITTEYYTPPAHEPGAFPKWLGEMSVNIVIAGGMGQRAQQLFDQNNIKVIVGAANDEPKELVQKYLSGTLECGQNVCDH